MIEEDNSGLASVAVESDNRRESLDGCWILDKTRGEPSMRGYLETMGADPLAIEAHEKGENEHNTFHTISFTKDGSVLIVKRSRVNNDLKVQLELGKETIQYLPPGNREKRSLAVSNHPGHLEIRSSIMTVNGMGKIVDVKNLQQEPNTSILLQSLTITNEQTGQSHVTTRCFLPYSKTPPHLVDNEQQQQQQQQQPMQQG